MKCLARMTVVVIVRVHRIQTIQKAVFHRFSIARVLPFRQYQDGAIIAIDVFSVKKIFPNEKAVGRKDSHKTLRPTAFSVLDCGLPVAAYLTAGVWAGAAFAPALMRIP
jgi:hypothetical protein